MEILKFFFQVKALMPGNTEIDMMIFWASTPDEPLFRSSEYPVCLEDRLYMLINAACMTGLMVRYKGNNPGETRYTLTAKGRKKKEETLAKAKASLIGADDLGIKIRHS